MASLTAAAMLAGAAVLAGAPAALAASAGPAYSDISGSPNEAAITYLTTQGVLTGYPNGTFKPTQLITRAEFTLAVVRLMGAKAQGAASALANITPDFKDAKQIPTWAWGAVNYAQGNKLVEGYPGDLFKPEADITDVEAAAILIRAIGDAAAVSGTWPSNYTVAAYNLGLTPGVNFVTNLPATRADVAQMAYNAVIDAPTLQSGYVSGTPTGAPFDMGGDGMPQIAWSGTVGAVTDSEITLLNAQQQQILNAPMASTYQLMGASHLTTLLGAQVLVAENSAGQVDYVQLTQQGTSEQTGPLASSTVAPPTGYTRIYDWLVEQTGTTQYSLLMSNATLVPVVSITSSQGTNYYLNAPTGGASLDPRSLVSGASALGDGDSVNFVLNSAKQATAVYASGATYPDAVVTAINTTNNTLTVTTAQNSSYTVAIQPWTEITLNGASSNLSALQANDVVDVNLVGGTSGDSNAAMITDTRQSISGTISALTVQSSGSGMTTQLGITESSGTTVTVTESPYFQNDGANLTVGQAVELLLDSQGQARLALPLAAQQTVVLVQQLLTTQTATGTFEQILVDQAGKSVTYTLAAGVPEPAQPSSTGYLAALSVQPGTTTVTAIQPLQEFEPAGYTLKVLSVTTSSVVVQEIDSAGQATSTAFYVSASNGAVAFQGTSYVPLGQVPVGETVALWEAPGSQNFLGITYTTT